jgi:CspA family cold shock protein
LYGRASSRVSVSALWLDLLFSFRASVGHAEHRSFFQECADMPQGKVKRLVADRGFGFIETEQGDDLFFHHSEVQGHSIEELREGQRVEYEVGRGRKGPCATRIRLAVPTA